MKKMKLFKIIIHFQINKFYLKKFIIIFFSNKLDLFEQQLYYNYFYFKELRFV